MNQKARVAEIRRNMKNSGGVSHFFSTPRVRFAKPKPIFLVLKSIRILRISRFVTGCSRTQCLENFDMEYTEIYDI